MMCWGSLTMPTVWHCCRAACAEVEMLSADFLKTAQLLRQTYPDLEIVVPLVNAKRREQFERIKAAVAPDLSVHLLDGMGREAMVASDAALLASGTAALECMLLNARW